MRMCNLINIRGDQRRLSWNYFIFTTDLMEREEKRKILNFKFTLFIVDIMEIGMCGQ